ncbi:MAG: winged helix-turn-helix domain-containing protein [Acidimicrobiia bacterium]|nr:winged helix-turn-helix domain-containing protein [Acidimicrobiia bacterium]
MSVVGPILVVADAKVDGATVDELRRELGPTTVAPDREAVAAVASPPPRLVLLDRIVADREGPALLRAFGGRDSVPVVMFSSAAESPAERTRWLERGVDDFVPWAASQGELVARIRSVLRRREGTVVTDAPQVLQAGDLLVDLRGRRVSLGSRPVNVTPLEFTLLVWFMRHAGTTLTKEALLRDVWGYSVGPTSTVTVHVRRLRQKLEPTAARSSFIHTDWGVGYRFEPSGLPGGAADRPGDRQEKWAVAEAASMAGGGEIVAGDVMVGRTFVELAEQLQTALDSRVALEQAKGVVAEQAGVGVDEALRLLRRHARHHNRRLSEVVAAVVNRELSATELRVRPATPDPRPRRSERT